MFYICVKITRTLAFGAKWQKEMTSCRSSLIFWFARGIKSEFILTVALPSRNKAVLFFDFHCCGSAVGTSWPSLNLCYLVNLKCCTTPAWSPQNLRCTNLQSTYRQLLRAQIWRSNSFLKVSPIFFMCFMYFGGGFHRVFSESSHSETFLLWVWKAHWGTE